MFPPLSLSLPVSGATFVAGWLEVSMTAMFRVVVVLSVVWAWGAMTPLLPARALLRLSVSI